MRALAPAAAAVLFLLAGCGADGDDGAEGPAASTTERERRRDRERQQADEDGEGAGDRGGKRCPAPADDRELEAVTVEPLLEEPRVDAVVYPHPGYDGKPWSQWGQGIVAGGRFLSAIGDHCGVNGDSYLFAFDPATGTLEPLGDVLSIVAHDDGDWGYGKIHAPMVEGGDGAVYATTFYGSNDGIEYAGTYEGDRLLRIDPTTGEITDLGAPLPGMGIPSLASSAEHGLLYGEAIEPGSDPRRTVFFVYDLERNGVVATAEKGDTPGVRSILVDGAGRAHFSTEDGVDVFDPATGEVADAGLQLPGAWLRAASRPSPDGTVYGVTREPDALFALTPDGEVRDLGAVRGYVASIALSPDGDRLYYVPEAHGDSAEQGTPLIEVDTATGEDRVVVELAAAGEDRLGLRLGGSYDVVVDPDGERVYVGLNAGDLEGDEAFGEVVLAVVELR